MNVTALFEMEGVARIRGKRSDALGEQTICRQDMASKKMRARDNYLFKTTKR